MRDEDIIVLQEPALTAAERLYLPQILDGMRVTLRHMFSTAARNRRVTQYPEQKNPQRIENYRGVHRLNRDPEGRVACVACFMCSTACPVNCIHIEAGESPWPDREKYPTGRMIVRVGRTIVEDKKNPYKHSEWPIVAFRDTIVPHRIWGATTVKDAGPLQRWLNLMESLIGYNTHTQTTGMRFTFPGGIPRKKLERDAGKPGVVFEVVSPHLMPKMEYPNPLPHGILEQRGNLLESIDKAMRIQETVPPGARGWPASGEVVEQMRESQQVEIRDTADNFAEGIGRIANQIAANTQQFYNKERYARIVGPLPKALDGMEDPNTGELIAVSENDNLHYVKFNPDNLKRGFDTSVVEATWQPMSKKARFDALMDLQERFPDDVTIDVVLENIDLKGKEKILRAYRERTSEPPPEEAPMGPEGMPPDGMMPPGMAPPGMGMPPPGGMPPPMMGPPPGMM